MIMEEVFLGHITIMDTGMGMDTGMVMDTGMGMGIIRIPTVMGGKSALVCFQDFVKNLRSP